MAAIMALERTRRARAKSRHRPVAPRSPPVAACAASARTSSKPTLTPWPASGCKVRAASPMMSVRGDGLRSAARVCRNGNETRRSTASKPPVTPSVSSSSAATKAASSSVARRVLTDSDALQITATWRSSVKGSKATGPVEPNRCQAVSPCGHRVLAIVATARCMPCRGVGSRRTATPQSALTTLLSPSAATNSRAETVRSRAPSGLSASDRVMWPGLASTPATEAGATRSTRPSAARHSAVVMRLCSATRAKAHGCSKVSEAVPSSSQIRITRTGAMAPGDSPPKSAPRSETSAAVSGVSATVRMSSPKSPRTRAGGVRSTSATRQPADAKASPAANPTMPAPTTATS